ncbi:methyltransferase family protein [Streptomyces sp. NPDC057638]|uniref:methyltransferase family protein n=1 Tax=Streptomyces sp. NPDC057638 TaxID=3346190 RepID=UPI0036AA3909
MALTSLLALTGLLLWAAFELLLRRRDPAAADWRATPGDRGSTRFLLVAYALSILITLVLTPETVGAVPTAWRWAGIALIVLGLALRAWGMRTLGRFYTRTLRTVRDQPLIQDGPYRLIRHPGYAGSLLVWTGYCLGRGNGIALLLVAALLLAAYSWRIATEERLLLATFGEEYAAYQRRTKRLVPYVY